MTKSETGQCQPLCPQTSPQPGSQAWCQRSEVRGGGPGFLDVGVHGLWEPRAVLSQQVCRRREGGVRVALCPATAAGTPSRQPRVASAGPVPSTPQLGHGAPAGSHSHLGFFLQAASKASRQSALSATRALSRISVLGCSLWVGVRAMGRHAARRLAAPAGPEAAGRGGTNARAALPGGVTCLSLHHVGVLDGQIWTPSPLTPAPTGQFHLCRL